MFRRALALSVVLIAGVASAGDAVLRWTYDDFASIRSVAAGAKDNNRRLLIGVSGGETCCPDEHLRDGPLATSFNDEAVVAATEAYRRLLVRAPESELFASLYDAKWPSLLVTDADGRRVGILQLVPGMPRLNSPQRIAGWLDEMAVQTPEERYRISVDPAQGPALAARLAEPAVLELPEGEEVRIRYRRGTVTVRYTGDRAEDVLVRLRHALVPLDPGAEDGDRGDGDAGDGAGSGAASRDARAVAAELVDPLPVVLRATDAAAASPESPVERLSSLPGVRAIEGFGEGADRRAGIVFVSPLLLDPASLAGAAPGYTVDLTTEEFRFRSLPPGNAAADPMEHIRQAPGVLVVVPDLFRNRLTVIGRPGALDRARLARILARTGAKLDDAE